MKTFLVLSLIFLCTHLCISQERKVAKPLLSDHYVKFAPNNNSIWFSNNGDISFNPTAGSSGWEYPIGSGKYVCFEVGLVWGGKVNSELRIGGSTFRHGLQGGRIDANGQASDSSDIRYRVYHIKREDASSGSNPDYNNWPSSDGAPVDANGKPYFLSDEQLWFVSNDLNSLRTNYLNGTSPIGLEIQTTVWAFNKNSRWSDIVFVRHLMINKSQYDVDSAYIGLLADWDIGDAEDDLVGVDTTIQLAYGYNGHNRDGVYGYSVPASGTLFLQTPIVASLFDTVIANGTKKIGYKYCPLAGHIMVLNGSSVYGDPYQGGYPQQMFYWLKGFLRYGSEPIDPTTGKPTHFCVAGNPLTRIGWIDGVKTLPGNKRTFLSAGPFTFTKGDTQEVVYAMVTKKGGNRIESVAQLFDYARDVKSIYQNLHRIVPSPIINININYILQKYVGLEINVIDSLAVSAKAVLINKTGNIVAEIPLFDDGMHYDGGFGDHRFAALWYSALQKDGVDIYIDITYPDGYKNRWLGKSCVPLCGKVRLVDAHVESDDMNQDGKANPGENIRITLDVKNETPFTLENIICHRWDSLYDYQEKYALLNPLSAWTIDRRDYHDAMPDRFITLDIPQGATAGEKIRVNFLIQDSDNNSWEDSVFIPVNEYTNPSFDSLTNHVVGNCTGTLGYRTLNQSEWKNHSYKITVQDITDTLKVLTLFDITEGTVRASNIPIPNLHAHDSPTIDGFRITSGTIPQIRSFLHPDRYWIPQTSSHYYPENNMWFYAYEFFDASDTANYPSALARFDLVPVQLIFSKTSTQKAYVYLRGSSPQFGYVGMGTVPFRAYDVREPEKPRQINVAFVEKYGSSIRDNQWMPTTRWNDAEFLHILKSTYSETPNPFYTSKIMDFTSKDIDRMYFLWLVKNDTIKTFHERDTLLITPFVPISARDIFTINYKGTISPVRNDVTPNEVMLHQNYPNPFSISAAIGYRLLAFGHVKLEVFDLLGRKVVTLVDEEQEAGNHEVMFNKNDLQPGIYYCILRTLNESRVMKMMVMR